MKTPDEKRHPCDSCGHDMYDPKTNNSVTGVRIEVAVRPGEEKTAHAEFKRIIDTFGKSDFDVCYVCWLKSLGVKPKKK